MSRTFVKTMAVLLLCIVLVAGVYIFINRPAPATRTASETDAIAQVCRNELTPLVDTGLFAGADRPGSPDHVLASYVKWIWISPLEWVGARDDISMIVRYGSGFHKCYLFDGSGYVLAYSSRHGESSSVHWIERADVDGGVSLTFLETDPAVREGKPTAWYTVTVDPQGRELKRLQLAGSNAGARSREGRYEFDSETGRLELWVGQEDRAVFGADGLLLRSYHRPCYDPDLPCEDPWEETVYKFDAAGNLISRDIDLGAEQQHDELELVTNDRGDWLEWRFKTATADNQATRRAIVYRK